MTETQTAPASTEEIPYELRAYIERAQRDAASANHADHKATFQTETDAIRDRAIQRYAAGKKLINDIHAADPKDIGRCQRLYGLSNEFGGNDLVEERVMGQWVIVPKHVTLISRMRKLREAIA